MNLFGDFSEPQLPAIRTHVERKGGKVIAVSYIGDFACPMGVWPDKITYNPRTHAIEYGVAVWPDAEYVILTDSVERLERNEIPSQMVRAQLILLARQ